MALCPNGCTDDFDQLIELEFGFDQDNRPAYMCGHAACGYRDLRVDMSFA